MTIASVTKTCKMCGAKYEIRKKLHGSLEAQRWEKYMEGLEDGLCWRCKKAEEKAKEEAENAAYKEQIAKHDLVPLTGTPKQIKWGQDIRKELLVMTLKYRVPTDVFWDLVNKREEAAWWINNRHICTSAELAKALTEDKEDK